MVAKKNLYPTILGHSCLLDAIDRAADGPCGYYVCKSQFSLDIGAFLLPTYQTFHVGSSLGTEKRQSPE